MMMRMNYKTILLTLIVAVASSLLTSWNNCGYPFFLRPPDWKYQFQHKVSKSFQSTTINDIFIIKNLKP